MSFLNVGKTVIEVTKTTMFRVLTDSYGMDLCSYFAQYRN